MEANLLLKKLRTERNLSQRKLAADISERSTLATFEQKGHRIAFDILYKYLDRLNVTLEEFEYHLTNNQLNEKKQLSKQFHNAYYQHDYDQLAILIDESKTTYQETQDFFYYLLYSQYYLILKKKVFLHTIDETEKIEAAIKSYLDKIETWGKFEITIFANLMFLFTDEYILFQIEQLNKQEFYNNLLSLNYHIYSKLLTNAAFLFIDRNQIDHLKQILFYMTKNIPLDNDRIRLMIRYFEGIIAIFHGEIETGKQTITKAIEILHFLGQSAYAAELSELATNVLLTVAPSEEPFL
ncbi:Rgg/GadR/MutR family transcriptional regulator [Enterococcus gallinarum]|uniref:Rgg/GadR/MutR family transcriptional regulator n=1 Tax=Enterococcus gallinarum TaxID=1353 RepID=UPI000F502BDB|nr:Rgg/GadR/MutR family transcriptional regulator [Enterococcus gallinarum]ROZ03515.1 Rgg/GadR/MutR family transcriptional regulator [Enterococcus gallinarum]ROZ09947.1 Rgg/GadR/MutR family transcriptional regulator [Enterococcus gallinarum]